MKKSLGIFIKNRCKSCGKHLANRYCSLIHKKICYHCCNKQRITGECPDNCKYFIQKKHGELGQIIYCESIAEQQELLDLQTNKWIHQKNKLFNDQTPFEFSQSKQGKKQLHYFFSKQEIKLHPYFNYNNARKKLNLPIIETKEKSYEYIAQKFLDLVIDENLEETVNLLVNKSVYKDKKYLQNYITRSEDNRSLMSIRNYDLIRSALNKDLDSALVEFECNDKYFISIGLKKSDSQWQIGKKVFGEMGVVLSEDEALKGVEFHLAKKQYEQAFKELSNHIQTYPDSVYLYYYFGMYYSLTGNIKEAKQSFFTAMELKPGLVEAKYNYAFLFQAQGNMKEAQKIYEEILKEREDMNTLNNLAVIYEHNGDIKKAYELLHRSLKLNPDFELAKKNLERIKGLMNADIF